MKSENEQLPKEEVCEDSRKDSRKEPYFYWTKELVAEFAHQVALSYKDAVLWTGDDLGAEQGMVDSFIKMKKYQDLHKDLIISDAGTSLIVDKKKFEEIIKFLFNYRDGY